MSSWLCGYFKNFNSPQYVTIVTATSNLNMYFCLFKIYSGWKNIQKLYRIHLRGILITWFRKSQILRGPIISIGSSFCLCWFGLWRSLFPGEKSRRFSDKGFGWIRFIFCLTSSCFHLLVLMPYQMLG